MVVKSNLREFPDPTKSTHNITEIFLEIEKASREGNRHYAYQRSVQATHMAPSNIEAWLWRLALAPTFEERVACVSRLNELAPHYRDRNNLAYFTQRELLERNPFLAYLDETDELYRVLTGNQMEVSIRKKRNADDLSHPEESGGIKAAYGWLVMAIVGLLAAGIGTVLFAPLAGLFAIQAGRRPRTRSDWVHSIVVLTLSILFFLLGLGLSYLFWLHWSGAG
jgi:hypothetical protein